MSGMENDINFIQEEGERCKDDLVVYALSTCGFCRRALIFLRQHSIKFKYVYFDEQEPALQETIIKKLRVQFNEDLSFPFLVINCKKYIIGFDQEEWEKELL